MCLLNQAALWPKGFDDVQDKIKSMYASALKKKNILEISILFVTILMVGYVAFVFSVSDQAAGFSDDSATYLIMAMVFSPFKNELINVLNSYHHYHLPPGFPLVLSLFDGGNNLYISHCVIFSQALLSCIVIFYLCKSIIGTLKAFLALLFFICMSGFWVQILKIGSEYQYICLSFTFLLIFKVTNNNINKKIYISIIFGVLLAFCMLTRSIGISLVIAYTILAFPNFQFKKKPKEIIGFFVGLCLPILVWKIFQPSNSHSYIYDIFSFINSDSPIASLLNIISTNVTALNKGITLNFSLISAEYNIYVTSFMMLIVVLAMIGWIIRIKKIDGLYVLIYFSVLLIWPYPSEMDRFVFPIIPLLILYIFVAINFISYKSNYKKAPIFIYVFVILCLTFPSLSHIVKRYKLGVNQYGENISNIIELYEIENTSKAIITSLIMKKNIETIRLSSDIFKKDDKVLSIKPQLFTYLSGIYAEELPRINGELPDERLFNLWLTYINQTNATHILLLPIELSPGFNEIDAVPFLSSSTEKVFGYGYIFEGKEKATLAILQLL